jgi:hypothetical protein
MKNFLLVLTLLVGTRSFAQKTASGKSIESSGYGVLSTQFSKFNGQNAIFAGAYGGWMINHKLMIGIGGYGLATQHSGYGLNEHTQMKNNWKMGYAGLMGEYTFFENRDLHFSVNALVGGGIVKNGNGRGTIPENGSDELQDIDAACFFVVQPGVNVEYSITNWFQVGAGVGYRYIRGSNQPGISDAKMSAPTANLSFKFGVF